MKDMENITKTRTILGFTLSPKGSYNIAKSLFGLPSNCLNQE
jgi:hypothetical protein